MPPVSVSGEGWIPVAYGALDVRGLAGFSPQAEVLLVPPVPGEALCLIGEGAAVWRRLVGGTPVSPRELTDAENGILDHLQKSGLVVLGASHPAAVTSLDRPVLSSALHELVYALVQHVADAAGIRCVFVKGPALHHQGLREREQSGDVDVWCDPSRWDDLANALEPWGWAREPDPWRGTSVHHSTTLAPLSWGCEIDIHRRFPGLTIDDGRAFEAIARHEVAVTYAGTRVAVPGRDAHAVLHALHATRPSVGTQVSTHDRRVARDALGSAAGSLRLARELGAEAALRAELAEIFPDYDPPVDAGIPRDWIHRAQPDLVHSYLAALRTLPLRERLRAVRNLVWPPDDIALASARRAGTPTLDPGLARRRRLLRGIRSWMRLPSPKDP